MKLANIGGRMSAAARILFALCALVGFVPMSSAVAQELHFLTWSEYMDPEIVQEFEEKLGVKVKFTYFESDDDRTALLQATDGKGYDVVITDGTAISKYAKQQWLAPISESEVPNKRHIDHRWTTAHPEAGRFAVPYFWGTLGIAYRSDLVPEGVDFSSWMQLFNPPEALRGKIVMNKNARDLTAAALKALGYSMNTSDRKQLAEAEALLQGQKPYVKAYTYLTLSEESALVTGDIVASMMYSGDALMVQAHNDNITLSLPKEGGQLWVDYFAVMQSSPNKELAMKFINFMNKPEIAARQAEFVYYATPNTAAEKLLPEEFLADPVIYPGDAVIARSEFVKKLKPRAQNFTNGIAARLVN